MWRRWIFVGLILSIVGSGTRQIIPIAAAPPSQEELPQLTVWWPDALLPSNREDATLETEFNRFRNNSAIDLQVRYRLYTEIEQANELALIQTVAPTALPDLTLMQQRDFIEAVELGLLQPIDGWIPNEVVRELAAVSPNLLLFGQVNDVTYGIPYLLTVDHMIYDPTVYTIPPTRLQDYLTQSVPILFPSSHGADEAVNRFLLSQYLAAGGDLVNEEGTPSLNIDIVEEILNFYAMALDAELFNPSLSYENSTSISYREQIPRNPTLIAFVNSRTFMIDRPRRLADYAVAPLPTLNGAPFTLVDGWLWVLLTEDPLKQAQARSFMIEMMRPDTLYQIASLLNLLPSQQGALRYADDPYVTEMQTLMSSLYYIPPDIQVNRAAAALQEAFKEVLRGVSPEEAIQNTIELLD